MGIRVVQSDKRAGRHRRRLLGARDLGTSDDYNTEKMPAVNVGLLNGDLAWRQHDGGHTDGPNWRYFVPWAEGIIASSKK